MVKRVKPPHSRLAGYSAMGHIWINPDIPPHLRKRVRIHEKTEIMWRRRGLSYLEAHHKALKVEHKGLSQKAISRYEGTLGACARWHPAHRKR